MINVAVIISLLLHIAVPVLMYLYYESRLDKMQRQIELLKDDVLFAGLKATPPVSSKYSPQWRANAEAHKRRVLNATRA